MSLECSECERTMRGPHDESCSRYVPIPTPTHRVDTVVSHYAWHSDCGFPDCGWFCGGERATEEAARGACVANMAEHYRTEHGVDI